MRVSELKAELELRKIDYAGMFEKEELARCLADARAGGRADPSLLDDFNRESMERAFESDGEDAAGAPDFAAAAEAVASDGGLPGGLSPERLQALVQDPELMTMLRNPKMQEVGSPALATPRASLSPESILQTLACGQRVPPRRAQVMRKVMEGGPEAAADSMSDPETREMLAKLSALMKDSS